MADEEKVSSLNSAIYRSLLQEAAERRLDLAHGGGRNIFATVVRLALPGELRLTHIFSGRPAGTGAGLQERADDACGVVRR